MSLPIVRHGLPEVIEPVIEDAPREGEIPQGEVISARISHYWPPLGGPNCARFVGGVCVSNMASGKPWRDYVDVATACPKEFPFGTRFVVLGKEWVCLDRGGKVVRSRDGIIWLDLLTPHAPVPYGTILDVEVVK